MQVVGRDFRTGEAVELQCTDRIVAVRAAGAAGPVERLPWIAPGFVDLQVNGYRGREFSSPQLSADQVAGVADQMHQFGVTRFLPTVTTASRATLEHALATISRAVAQIPRLRARVAGIHLEGPYISPDDGPRRARPRCHCRPPDWDEFAALQAAAGGLIRLVTLSAEYPEAPEFIARLRASGVYVGAGPYECARPADRGSGRGRHHATAPIWETGPTRSCRGIPIISGISWPKIGSPPR